MDKRATILEAEWMEKEIPRIKEELNALKALEQELLTTPLETVSSAYENTYRDAQKTAYAYYRRRRRVVPTRYGLRERMVEEGWLAIGFRILMILLAVLAVYVAYHNHQQEQTQRGIVWASILLILGIVLSFAPMVGAYFWQRQAKQNAKKAADLARQSDAFLEEKHERQLKLAQCQERMTELEERLNLARLRYDYLRQVLTSGDLV
jgi:uncharacterized protein HemX